MKFWNLNIAITVAVAIILATGCSSDSTEDINKNLNAELTKKVIRDSSDLNKVKVIFYNVPSPVEMAHILHRTGVEYNSELINSVKIAEKYGTSPKIALNLGVYGADLSYVRMFDQMQESLNYLAIIKKFSEKLGIPSDKGSFTVGRLEENLNNRDSLLSIISETYANADMYLKENNRGSTAALIIMGGWVEALYIASSLVTEKTANDEIKNRIAEQKYSLNNMIELMNTYKSDETVSSFLPSMIELKTYYEKINAPKKNAGNESSKSDITIQNIKEINAIVVKLRNEFIK